MNRSVFMKALLGILVLVSAPAFAGKPSPKTFVLVHGAWQGPWAWEKVKKNLESKGQKVVIVELPGHGNDATAAKSVSMNVYRDKVIDAINTVTGKVVLVGHSMGGMVITAVADKIPSKIEKLVYVGAFVPASGQSLMELSMTDKEALLGPAIRPADGGLTLDIVPDSIVDIFCKDASADVQKDLLSHYKKEPAIPFGDKVIIDAATFAGFDKYYIKTLNDKAVGPQLQDRMITAAGIKKVYPLKSGHCPFLSMPDEMTKVLLTIVK
jgi:pimeloyl-ACP methyl ester carboxylesterase